MKCKHDVKGKCLTVQLSLYSEKQDALDTPICLFRDFQVVCFYDSPTFLGSDAKHVGMSKTKRLWGFGMRALGQVLETVLPGSRLKEYDRL